MSFLPTIFNSNNRDFYKTVKFQTNSGSGTTFDPSITKTAGNPIRWKLGSESLQYANTISFTFADSSTKTVEMGYDDASEIYFLTMSNDNLTGDVNLEGLYNVTRFFFENNPGITSITLEDSTINADIFHAFNNTALVGTLDLSPSVNLSRSFQIYSTGVSAIIFPSNARAVTSMIISFNSNLGPVDFSTLTAMGGPIDTRSNTSMTSMTFPTSSTAMLNSTMENGGLSGTLDISGMTGFGTKLTIFNNPALTNISFPFTSNSVNTLTFYSCNITSTIDLSPLTGLGGIIYGYSNPNLTGVTFPTVSITNPTTFVYFNDCNITGSVDFSGLDLAGQVIFSNNANLTGVTIGSHSNIITILRFENTSLTSLDITGLTGSNDNIIVDVSGCSLLEADVNQLCIDLDAKGWIDGSLDLVGLPAATGAGLTARNNLSTNGWTVLT